jgi:hypothetical protein
MIVCEDVLGNKKPPVDSRFLAKKWFVFCGEGGIRTHDSHEAVTVFETAPFNRSGTSPNETAAIILHGIHSIRKQ